MTEKVKEYIASLRGKKIAFVGMGAVSYTHLTLPTIA